MEIKSLKDLIKTTPDKKKIVSIPKGKDTNKCYFFCGQDQGAFISEQTFKLIEILSLKLYVNFPDRKDKRLAIGDGCSSNGGTVEGHGSHAGGYRIDFNYFTHTRNTTHYVPSWMNTSQSKEKGMLHYRVDQEIIWKFPDNGKVLLPNFDWERNFIFFYWICDILPYSEILISRVIRNRIELEARKKYPEQWKQIAKNLRDTDYTGFNHHLHVHCDFGSSGSSKGFDVDWDKEREWLKCKF